MAEDPEVTVEGIPQTGDIEEIVALLRRGNELVARRRGFDAELALAVVEHKRECAPINKKQASVEARLAYLLPRHRRSLLRRYGHTITLPGVPGSVINIRRNPKSLDTPKDEDEIVAFLLSMRNGKKYLNKPRWSLNRDAITQAGGALHAKLRRFGAFVGQHDTISVKWDGEKEPKVLSRRLFRGPKTS